MGVLLWRGFGLASVMNQCFGNKLDAASKGRQMPMVRPSPRHLCPRTHLYIDAPPLQHFASAKHHFHPISSPLATQIPQAAGVGFALKRDPARRGKNCAAVFFGEVRALWLLLSHRTPFLTFS
jgi:2-oxoisovalerate dehydrogenase E1 component alpha subunit